jgi:serine/threonine-protein phosphatase 2B regulatory subunit
MVGKNLNDVQLQQIVDRTIVKSDKSGAGKINYDDFCKMIQELDIAKRLTLEY